MFDKGHGRAVVILYGLPVHRNLSPLFIGIKMLEFVTVQEFPGQYFEKIAMTVGERIDKSVGAVVEFQPNHVAQGRRAKVLGCRVVCQ